MPTLIPDPLPVEVEQLLQRRHESGADRRDEVWEGVLHVSPPPSSAHEGIVVQLQQLLFAPARARGLVLLGAAGIGARNDHRVPDLTLLEAPVKAQWQPTAALVVEVLSPHDDTWQKLGFYIAHDVSELVIVDPAQRTVDWRGLRENAYGPIERSAVIDVSAADIAQQIDWEPFPITPDDH